MTTRLVDLPIEKVRQHPHNVRWHAVADDDLIASIKSVGVLEPVVVGPADADGIHDLIMGNRRWDGTVKAGLTTIPAIIREDLVTLVQQVEVMLVENLNREGISWMEESGGYEQLTLGGMDSAAIAASVGRSRKVVESRLRLRDLPDRAQQRLHEGQATLADAETLLEFDDDHEVQARLERAFGTTEFRWMAQNARDDRARVVRHAKIVEGFKEQGAYDAAGTEWMQLFRFTNHELQDPEAHTEDGCLGYIAWEATSKQQPVLVCTNPDNHTTEQPPTAQTPTRDYAAEQAAAAALHADRLSASKVRVDHIVTVLATAVPSKGKHAATLARAARALLPITLSSHGILDVVDTDVLDHALGLDTAVGDWQARNKQRDTFAADLAIDGKDNALLTALVGLLAALAENALSTVAEHGSYPNDSGVTDHAMADIAWEWLTSTGFPLADIDLEVRALATNPDTDDAEDDD